MYQIDYRFETRRVSGREVQEKFRAAGNRSKQKRKKKTELWPLSARNNNRLLNDDVISIAVRYTRPLSISTQPVRHDDEINETQKIIVIIIIITRVDDGWRRIFFFAIAILILLLRGRPKRVFALKYFRIAKFFFCVSSVCVYLVHLSACGERAYDNIL